ncbi:MAG: glycosyltransferase [Akkermansia sp.]|nr:glycosyltransferase [Akkermansia sp.]
MRRIKVLELGWEFPPLINGGLGVACMGISKALAKKVDLSVIVPKADPSAVYDGFTLTGINNLRYAEVESVSEGYSYNSFSLVSKAPVNLDPYAHVEGTPGSVVFTKEGKLLFSHVSRADLELFTGKEDLYAGDLARKVIEFSKICAVLARQYDFDVVHAHDWMTYLAGVEVKKATGKPLVVHLHASQFDRAGADARGWIYDIEKYGMEQADAVMPVSKYTGTVAAGHYGINPDKIFPVHNGADPVKVFHSKKKFPEKLVLFLGRLTAQKGPEFFLQIAAKVLEQTDDVRFVMAGTGEKLRQLIETGAFHGVGDKFHFTGFLNKQKVNELLSMTDVYCMPSVSEPFGLSALEAAQFNIPAVISKQSGVAEVMKGALKADFWDVNMMAKHIIDLTTDEELYKKVAEESAQDIKNSSWETAADKMIRVYHHVLGW